MCRRRRGKGREETITCRVDLTASEPLQLFPDEDVVTGQQFRHRASPRDDPTEVESTMSVNRIVVSFRLGCCDIDSSLVVRGHRGYSGLPSGADAPRPSSSPSMSPGVVTPPDRPVGFHLIRPRPLQMTIQRPRGMRQLDASTKLQPILVATSLSGSEFDELRKSGCWGRGTASGITLPSIAHLSAGPATRDQSAGRFADDAKRVGRRGLDQRCSLLDLVHATTHGQSVRVS